MMCVIMHTISYEFMITKLGGLLMKLKDISQEELELMSYDDIAVLILEETAEISSYCGSLFS